MVDTRERRHRRTRQAILDAAMAIIHEAGPAGLSMRALAERIDYSAAGIYEYFAGKDEIIAAVCQEGDDRLAGYMRRSDPDLPVADYLREIGLAYIRFAVENPDYFLMMFTSGPMSSGSVPRDPAPAIEHASAFEILVQTVRRGLAEGVFRERPDFGLMEIVYAAWATVHGAAMLRAIGLPDYPVDLDHSDRAVVANLIRGLQVL
jgi:AcrR family transcriptional regulator